MLKLLSCAFFAAGVYTSGFAALGCSDADPPPSFQRARPDAASPNASTSAIASPAPKVVVLGEARWPAALGESLELLYPQYEAIVVGRISSVVLPYDPRPGFLDTRWEPAPSGHSKAGLTPPPEAFERPPGRGFTVFEVQVDEAFGRDAPSRGDVIYVGQPGGMWEGAEHRVDEKAPIYQLGNTYLMALDRSETILESTGQSGYFSGLPFAEYLVNADRTLEPLDEFWRLLPTVQQLDGANVNEALARIDAALTKATPVSDSGG